VFENNVLMRIYGPKRDEIIGWRKLCKELKFVLINKYYSHDKLKEDEMGRACNTYEREEECIRGFCRKS
jgi:hypothetical protein